MEALSYSCLELPPSIQQKLAQGDIVSRPLTNLNATMRDLNLTADEVRALIEMGYLIAFNIAAGAARKELRILTRSIEHFQLMKRKTPMILEWPQLFRLIIRHQKPVVTGLEIQRGLNCDRSLVENLSAAGCFTVLKKAHPGPGGTPAIDRPSFETFLKNRQE